MTIDTCWNIAEYLPPKVETLFIGIVTEYLIKILAFEQEENLNNSSIHEDDK